MSTRDTGLIIGLLVTIVIFQICNLVKRDAANKKLDLLIYRTAERYVITERDETVNFPIPKGMMDVNSLDRPRSD